MNLISIARAPHAQLRQLALDGDQVGEDLDGREVLVQVGVRPARDLVQVRADARDLPGALTRCRTTSGARRAALSPERRGAPRSQARR